jgi:hypothetical protein
LRFFNPYFYPTALAPNAHSHRFDHS